MAQEVTFDASPDFVNDPTILYDASSIRMLMKEDPGRAPGVLTPSDAQVTFTSSLTVTISAGTIYIPGYFSETEGHFRAYRSTSCTVDLTAADASNPRIDGIYAVIYSTSDDGNGLNKCTIKVLTGTAQAAATLDNRGGAKDPFTNFSTKAYILLADCLVNANNSPAFSGTNIRDRRTSAVRNTPPIFVNGITGVQDAVQPEPYAGLRVGQAKIDSDYTSKQSCVLFWNPKRIVGATKIRWHYHNGSPGLGTSVHYKWALCDASGAKFAETGITAFGTSTADLAANPVDALTSPTDIPKGWLRVWFGVDAISSGRIYLTGVLMDFFRNGTDYPNQTYSQPGSNPVLADICFRNGSLGTTFGSAPDSNTIRYMNDHSVGNSSGGQFPPVPLITITKE